MNPLRLLIVDDEALARLRLRSLVDSLPEAGAEVVAEAGDAEAALALLQTTPVDGVLLDIRLPGRDGLRPAAALRALGKPPAVIFVTEQRRLGVAFIRVHRNAQVRAALAGGAAG